MALERELYQQRAEEKDLLAAAAAFFKWRQAAMKAQFKKQLEEIMNDVADEENVTDQLKQQRDASHRRCDELSQALSKVSSDQRTILLQLEQVRAQNDELFLALEKSEGASRAHAEQARANNVLYHDEVARRQEDQKRAAVELSALQEQHAAVLTQQQTLLESLAQRDREVAETSKEMLTHRQESQRLMHEVERLEGILRATGERAAAAEAQAAAKGEAVTALYAQLAALRERYHAELSELKAARATASESRRMRERLDSMQSVHESLVAARDELRFTLDVNMAKLAAAEERLKRMGNIAGMRDTMVHALMEVDPLDDTFSIQATSRLGAELELALAESSSLAERLAAADAVIAQQEGHIARLAAECSTLGMQLHEAEDMRQQQHRINAELAAEMQRLAAEAALGPIMVLDEHGKLVPATMPPQPPKAASAPVISQLEAQSTALRAILADRGFGLGALCQAIAAKPGDVLTVRQQLGACRSGAEEVRAELERLSELLVERPVDGEALERSLLALLERLGAAESAMVASREDLASKQVHAVTTEARLLACESAIRQGHSLLAGWSGLLAEAAATEGSSRLEPDMRLGLREELKTREQALHRAILDLAATAPLLVESDPGYSVVGVALKEAGNCMMELAVELADRNVDAMSTRTRALITEQALGEKAAHIARYRSTITKVPGEVADMVQRLTAIIPDVQGMAPALEEMLRVVRRYLAVGRDEVVDVVQLQQELLTLRGLLRAKDAAIKELEAVGGGIRSASPTKKAVRLVPIDALHAAERARDGLEGEKSALQSKLVEQRVRLVAVRHRLVDYVVASRADCVVAESFYEWRSVVLQAKAARSHTAMTEAQAEQARVEREAAEAAERRKVAAAKRRKALNRGLKRLHLGTLYSTIVAVLYSWRVQAQKQVLARQRWRTYAKALRDDEPEHELGWDDVMFGPRVTIARRLAQLHADPSDFREMKAVTGAQIARMVLQAWRAWTWIKVRAEKVDRITEALPLWVANIGDRRRMERAWLSWRLWMADCREDRAHEAIEQAEAMLAAQPSTQSIGVPATEPSAGLFGEPSSSQLPAVPSAGGISQAMPMDAMFAPEQMAQHMAQQQALSMGGASMPSIAPSVYGLPPASEGGALPLSVAGGVPTGTSASGVAPSAPLGVAGVYLPNAHTVLAPDASAPAHAAAAAAVAAAQAAGLQVSSEAMTSGEPGAYAQQLLPTRATSIAGAPPAGAGSTAHAAGGSGPSRHPSSAPMPPVAGPREAAIAKRRASAPGASGRPSSMAGARARDPLRQVSTNAGAAAARQQGRASSGGGAKSLSGGGQGRPVLGGAAGRPRAASQGGAGSSGLRPVITALADRAERLAQAVEAVSRGIHSTAEILSPRTKLLQAAMAVTAGEQPGSDTMQRPSSPVRHRQPDGSMAVEYNPQPEQPMEPTADEEFDAEVERALAMPLGFGPAELLTERSPPRSPTRSGVSFAPEPFSQQPQQPQQEPSFSMQQSSAGGAVSTASGSVPSAAWGQEQQAPVAGGVDGGGHGASRGLYASASDAGAGQRVRMPPGMPVRQPDWPQQAPEDQPNSLQVLLSRLPGRFDPVRKEPRAGARVVQGAAAAISAAARAAAGRLTAPAPVSTAAGASGTARGRQVRPGSRLHDETVSTFVKRTLPSRPEGGIQNISAMPPAPLVPIMAPLSTHVAPTNTTPGPLFPPAMLPLEGLPTMADMAAATGFSGQHTPQAALPVRHAWPHVPADQLPAAGPSSSAPMAAPYRGAQAAQPQQAAQGRAGAWEAAQPFLPQRQQPQAPEPSAGGAARGAAGTGPRAPKVVRFERMTPPSTAGAGAGSQVAATSPPEAPPASAPMEAGPITYIRLPSPVRVSIRLQ